MKDGNMKTLVIVITLILALTVSGFFDPPVAAAAGFENQHVNAWTSANLLTSDKNLEFAPGSLQSVTDVVASVTPAVVFILADLGNDWVRMGSGIIIDPSGYILTNAHVIKGAEAVIVVLNDSREFPATILGKNETKDLAIIKISGGNFPFVKLGDSATLKPGDEVIAIGYPVADSITISTPTVSKGIVSALRNDGVNNLIQTDAAINEGNSGGPLVTMEGEVIGINQMKESDAEAIGFAIAINDAKLIIPNLENGMMVTDTVSGTDSSGTNFLWVLIIIVLAGAYFIPTIVAWKKRHENAVAVTLVNVFLGWSVIAWIITLIWALDKKHWKTTSPPPVQPAGRPIVAQENTPVPSLNPSNPNIPSDSPVNIQPASIQPPTAVVYPTVVYRGSKLVSPDGNNIMLTETTKSLGRNDFERMVPSNSLNLISRQHFYIKYESGKYYIEDYNSANGTKLNGIDIKGKGRLELRDGDSIDVGGIISLNYRTSEL
jgi:S1-C subfamily serine protease